MIAFTAMPSSAFANPWLKDVGAGEFISSGTVIREENGLASGLAANATTDFHVEYGATEDLTLAADADMQRRIGVGQSITVFDTGWIGARVPLKRWDYSALSAEFAGGVSGIQQPGLPASKIAIAGTAFGKLAFGNGFILFGRHAFAQIETGWRWRGGSPADEAMLDMGFGLEPWRTGLAMLQWFSIASVGHAGGAYRDYQIAKLQLSFAQGLTDRLWLQAGLLDTVLGSSAGEKGVSFAAWWRF